MDDLPHIVGALEHPLDSLKRELQQSVMRMNGLANQVSDLIKRFDEEVARIKGYSDTIENLQRQPELG